MAERRVRREKRRRRARAGFWHENADNVRMVLVAAGVILMAVGVASVMLR